jgi:hypothetical protein
MTALPSPQRLTGATSFERTLLRAASALDGFVLSRLALRSTLEYRRAQEAQGAGASARGAAIALGAIGMMPR